MALAGCHDDAGHQGRMRTISLLRQDFFGQACKKKLPSMW